MRKSFWLANSVLFVTLLSTCFFYSCKNDDGKNGNDGKTDANTPPPPKAISYSIINSYPHDTTSFTQGLIIYNGAMYEGTGNLGHSKLMKVDLKTGKSERSISLSDEFFGEGITILRDTVYQLTWQNRVVFIYSLNDFKKIGEFKIDTEGWGITTDGKELIVSDGTSNLYFYTPSNFKFIRKVTVTEGGSLAYNLNELEYIDGFVYANQWQAPYIHKIDPVTGLVVGKVDLIDIYKKVKGKDPHADVPNGIAYDSSAKKVYVTGKLWPELYEIQLGN